MKTIALFLSMIFSILATSQCEISNRILPDGTMYYYMEPSVFYFTKKQSLKGNIITDKENYYIALQPFPFPDKKQGKKLKENLQLKLSNNSIYKLVHFDTQYLEKDSILQLLYIIDKGDFEDFIQFEILQAKIDMKGTEGLRIYNFKLHKNAIQEQLACFLNEEKKK